MESKDNLECEAVTSTLFVVRPLVIYHCSRQAAYPTSRCGVILSLSTSHFTADVLGLPKQATTSGFTWVLQI